MILHGAHRVLAGGVGERGVNVSASLQERRHLHRSTGLAVGPCEHGGADFCGVGELRKAKHGKVNAALRVAELVPVIIHALRPRELVLTPVHPANEAVRLGLQGALSADYPVPVGVLSVALARLRDAAIALQDRRHRLLELQEQLGAVHVLQQHNEAAGANGANTHHPQHHVLHREPLEQVAHIV